MKINLQMVIPFIIIYKSDMALTRLYYILKGGTRRNHPPFLQNKLKRAIKFNKNIPVTNLARFDPKN